MFPMKETRNAAPSNAPIRVLPVVAETPTVNRNMHGQVTGSKTIEKSKTHCDHMHVISALIYGHSLPRFL